MVLCYVVLGGEAYLVLVNQLMDLWINLLFPQFLSYSSSRASKITVLDFAVTVVGCLSFNSYFKNTML